MSRWSTSRGRSLPERVYATLLVMYPSSFRHRYGRDAARVFSQLHGDARAAGPGAVLALWRRTIVAVVSGGLRERMDERRVRDESRPVIDGRPARVKRPAGGRGPSPSEMLRDARLALRTLVRRPGFAVLTIGLIGLGIGSTTAIFSIVYGVLLRPLPYPSSERLVHLQKDGSLFPVPDFMDVRDMTQTMDGVAAVMNRTVDLTGSGEAERLGSAKMTTGLFELLGARAWRGRLFTDEEYAPGADRVAILSMGLWLRRWGGDDSVIGRTLILNGEPATVVGVLGPDYVPPEGLGLEAADIYLPFDLSIKELQRRDMFVLAVIGRLRLGATMEAMHSEMASLTDRFVEEYGESWLNRDSTPQRISATPLMEWTVSGVSDTLWIFLGAVALMLLIACANVANLFLARATERTHEIAVRSALGAGRRRLIVQLLTESVTLALAGGLLGLILAFVGVAAFRSLDPGGIPRMDEVGVNAMVLVFAITLSGLTGILFGLAPAISSARTSASAAMRDAAATTTAGRSRSSMRNALIISQLALALVLLAGAGVLFNSFLRLRQVSPGFDPEQLLTVQLDVGSRVPMVQHAAFVHRLEERLSALPGVTAVGTSWRLPFDRGRCCWLSRAVDATAPSDTARPYIHPVTPDYFAALGAPIREGRAFIAEDGDAGIIPFGESAETPAARMPIIINRPVADVLWPGRPAVGQVLVMAGNATTEFYVVGVIDGMRHWRLNADQGQDVYIPFDATAAWDLGLLDVAIRHDGPPGPLVAAVRATFRDIDDQLPLDRIVPMESRIAGSIARPRFYTALLSTFAILAFLLAAGGVYGSMLYVVGLRRREMGIRVALGAGRSDVLRIVIGRGAALVVSGLALGIIVSLAVARVLESLAFGVSARDPVNLAIVAALLGAAGIAACWLPARRAANTDPVTALRVG